VSGSLSPRVPGLLTLAGLGLVAALASGRPELAVVAMPALIFVGVGLAWSRPPRLTAGLELSAERVREEDPVGVRLRLQNESDRGVEVDLELQRSSRLAMHPGGRLTQRIGPRGSITVDFDLIAARWGVHAIGPVAVRARDPLGITVWSGSLGPRRLLRAFPRELRLRELVAPFHTQPFLGGRVSSRRGEGIEFADIRPFADGDRGRQINWRATARRGTLFVTERSPEHSSDVVLMLDTFAEARVSAGGTLDAAVRAASSLARGHLARRDRVALVDFGGTMHWLEPAFGTAQLYRIIDALMRSEVVFSYAWRAVESIPRRLLPPGALIVAITPLLDPRSIRLVTDLHRRSDVTVVEVSPQQHVGCGDSSTALLAERLWRLQREALRARLRSLGIAVAVWDEQQMLGPAVEGVNAFRRFAGRPARG
jgi:uncharacterized protein (DUF58 family)